MSPSPTDWSLFDAFPESTCSCRCGHKFRSHAKVVLEGDRLTTYSRQLCPGCGKNDALWRVESDPETMTV